MQHGADTEQRPQVVHGASGRRQDGVFVGGKIQRFIQTKLSSAGPGRLFVDRQDGAGVHQVAKHGAADADLITGLQLLLGNGRTGNEGAVAAIQVFESAILTRSDEEAMAARNRCVFQLQIVSGLPADAILALRQKDQLTFQWPPHREQSGFDPRFRFQQSSMPSNR